MKAVLLAAEDEVSLAVLRRLVAFAKELSVFRADNSHGFGDLRASFGKFNETAAAGLPVVVLTDLDSRDCEASLREEWFLATYQRVHRKKIRLHEDFVFRVARREVESWLLADRTGFSSAFKLILGSLPLSPESLGNPKEELIRLVQAGPKRLWDGIPPEKGSCARIGPRYNELVGGFARDRWRPLAAAENAPSLARAITRIQELGKRCT